MTMLAAIDPTLPERTRGYLAKSIALRDAMLPHVGHYMPIDNARGVFIEGVRFANPFADGFDLDALLAL